jgi:hypothetical protein
MVVVIVAISSITDGTGGHWGLVENISGLEMVWEGETHPNDASIHQ